VQSTNPRSPGLVFRQKVRRGPAETRTPSPGRAFNRGSGLEDEHPQRLAVALLSPREVTVGPEQSGQVIESDRHGLVIPRKVTLRHLQRFAAEGLGHFRVPSGEHQVREVAEAGRYVRVIAWEEALGHLKCFAGEPLGSRQVTAVLEQNRQRVERVGGCPVVSLVSRACECHRGLQ